MQLRTIETAFYWFLFIVYFKYYR